MDISERTALIVEIARLYYEEHKTQEEIAKEMGVSRSTISRSLKRAQEIGAVQIRVVDPYFECSSTVEALRTRFGLERAIVVPVSRQSDESIKRDIGSAGADYLIRVVRDGMVLGVAQGTTLEELVDAIKPRGSVRLKVVQLVGSLGRSAASIDANELSRRIAEAFRGEWYLLPAPVVVESSSVRGALLREPAIRDILEMGRKADVALLGIGACDASSVMVQRGYLTVREVEAAKRAGAVGDICGRFYDIQGRPCKSDFDDRTIGITLEDLRAIAKRIGVAGGRGKAAAILGALRGRHINVLVTDEIAAREVLALDGYRPGE
ncbi:MAG: sugar-binding transcriptional regulator [Firmicutes bacterium]|nr:sugar-binding transcriptional regulator [Bacillota bacterium]